MWMWLAAGLVAGGLVFTYAQYYDRRYPPHDYYNAQPAERPTSPNMPLWGYKPKPSPNLPVPQFPVRCYPNPNGPGEICTPMTR